MNDTIDVKLGVCCSVFFCVFIGDRGSGSTLLVSKANLQVTALLPRSSITLISLSRQKLSISGVDLQRLALTIRNGGTLQVFPLTFF